MKSIKKLKALKAPKLTWSDYGWWMRRPDGSRYIFNPR